MSGYTEKISRSLIDLDHEFFATHNRLKLDNYLSAQQAVDQLLQDQMMLCTLGSNVRSTVFFGRDSVAKKSMLDYHFLGSDQAVKIAEVHCAKERLQPVWYVNYQKQIDNMMVHSQVKYTLVNTPKIKHTLIPICA
jgi:hypothetical protein